MKQKLAFSSLLLALSLASAPTARAITTWYVNGVNGSDSNNCQSSSTPCKTIGCAISLASSGDSIMVAAATYKENLIIGLSLNVLGSGAGTTIIDGGRVNTVITVSSANAHVNLSKLTIQNGGATTTAVASTAAVRWRSATASSPKMEVWEAAVSTTRAR